MIGKLIKYVLLIPAYFGFKLIGDASLDWVNEEIALEFGISHPKVADVMQVFWTYGLPALMVLLSFAVYHWWHTRDRVKKSPQQITETQTKSSNLPQVEVPTQPPRSGGVGFRMRGGSEAEGCSAYGFETGFDMDESAQANDCTATYKFGHSEGFPAPSGEFTKLSSKELKNKAVSLIAELKSISDDEFNAAPNNYYPRAVTISSEFLKRIGQVNFPAQEIPWIALGHEMLKVGKPNSALPTMCIPAYLNFLLSKLPDD